MPYGLRVVNDSGIIQIDDEKPNYTVIQRGVINVPGRNGATLGSATIGFPGQSTPAMVFIRPPYGVRMCGSDTPHTNENFKNDARIFNHDGACDVEYVIFGNRAEQPASSGYGLVLRNSQNQIVYCSNDTPVRLVGAFEYPADGNTRTFGVAGGPGRVFFSLCGTGWWEIFQSGGGGKGEISSYISQATVARIDNESQITLSNSTYPGAPGARTMGGVRMIVAARIN